MQEDVPILPPETEDMNGIADPMPSSNLRAMPGVRLEADPQIIRVTEGLAAAAQLGEIAAVAVVFLRSDGNLGSLRYCPTEPFKVLGALHVLAHGLAQDLARAGVDETPPPRAQ